MNLKKIFLLAGLLAAAQLVFPQNREISQWLVLGPAEILANGAALPSGGTAAFEYDFLPLSQLQPETGKKVKWSAQRQLSWQAGSSPFRGTAVQQVV
ncbi:MAG TPA: hypothetical protein VLQ89_04300, partial [Candidatus Binatia bacterium]|nr:hypothetical protein [Candidatus Binatia bacterium]